MKILSKASDNLKRSYNVLIDIEAINQEVDVKLKEVAQKTKMDGFRPGKVPVDIIRRIHGVSVREDAVKKLVDDTSQMVLREENLPPAFGLTTKIIKNDENGVEFSMNFELIPQVELMDFSTIEIVKHVPQITDKEINEIFNELRGYYKKWIDEPLDASVEMGHKVFMDLAIKTKLKKHINELTNDINFIIGDAELIEDFWKPLVGAKVGDTKEFTVNYPANLSDKVLAGKIVEYSAYVKKVQKAVDYELDDEFAKSIGHDDMEKALEWAKQRASSRYDYMSKDIMKRDLLEKISEVFSFEVPIGMLNLEYSEVVRQITEEAKKIHKEMTPEILKECKKIAEQRVRIGFVVAEVAKKEKITATKNEITKAIRSIAMMYPGQEKAIWNMYSRGEAVGAVVGPILETKVVAFLFEKIKIREEECSVEKLIELDEEPFDFFKDEPPLEKLSHDNSEVEKLEQVEPTTPEISESEFEAVAVETPEMPKSETEKSSKAHKSEATQTSKAHKSETQETPEAKKMGKKDHDQEASASEKAPKKTRKKKADG
ncbi:MAG: trigger factor [Holosporaceae bacterium]|nr:trigger factor [Holosporaceae bacterium]